MTLGTVEKAIITLTNYCDGAVSQDGAGWNRYDAKIGRSLTEQILSGRPLTFKQRKMVAQILPKYHNQFHNWEEVKNDIPSWVKRGEKAYNKKRKLEEKLPSLEYKYGYFYIKTSYNDNWIAKSIPKRRWLPEEKSWRYVLSDEVLESLIKLYDKFKTVSVEANKQIRDYLNKQKELEAARDLANQVKKQDSVELDIPLKSALYEHQKKAAKMGTILDNIALLMEQGTGKTLSAIAIATHRYLKGQMRKLLIIAPKSVLPEWARQFEEHTDLSYEAHVVEGKKDKKVRLIKEWDPQKNLKVLVINYESVWRLEKELLKWAPDMVICDESQKIKNARAKQSKSVTKIGSKAKYRLILTGTPVTQNPLDFFSQYKFLDPSIFGNNFVQFRDRYAVMGGFNNYQVIRFQNLEELAEKAHSIAYRVTKEEALDLPEEVHQNLYAELEPEAEKRYREMEEDSVLKLEGETVTAPIVLTQLMKLQQIAGGFIKTEEGTVVQVSNAKLNILKEAIEDLVLTYNKKVVIFARFIPEITAISEMLTKMKIRHHTLTGGTKNRGELIRDFQNNSNTKVFVINPKAGGTGITLTAADTAIFYSKDYSLEAYLQAMARIHRIGQKNKVTYIHILAKRTVDEAVTERLNNKQDLANLVVDDLKNLILNKEETGMKNSLEEKLNQLKQTIEAGEEVTEKALKELQELEGDPSVEKAKERNKVRKARKEKKAAREAERALEEQKVKEQKEAAQAQVVTVTDLAEELGVSATSIRKRLRVEKFDKPSGGRWEWPLDHPDLEKIKELFKGE